MEIVPNKHMQHDTQREYISSKHGLFFICITVMFVLGSLTACNQTKNSTSLSLISTGADATPTPASWLRLPEMPATASQADYGAEIYRLICQDCHGDHGQGLTAEWRATWAPEDQNCWQSRCHVGNHPPEGFPLPRYVPPLMGPGALSNYETGLDLYTYIRVNMPWHTPGNLQDWEYMQLTAFLARERQELTSEDLPLDEAKAAKLLLNPPS